uniref:Protein-serine/threonine kinase n=2 Tax=Noctiluca scintillans TaxID=2966 RepID=A0A7S1ADG8_NOCSC|mmetsp:Transcript_41349/g.109546  ORF Transcript_41349/g.109546 Transcript_41349/m.109546 type:complete len:409 (+) Transcript_41349:108-1334(+)|eukprot:CAMPEP_0194489974 /NCGR_PEP_ID=MMETSP0253-20130528/9347_1 /TAXON_ID=2966 /ORGANISM="Noctiluca scintillans" /LENGTH=408 /DNA_ID=CAMNT_0039330543 /DNA_START=93 /DNA_END=1319 /DNA_ORIENTATION=-
MRSFVGGTLRRRSIGPVLITAMSNARQITAVSNSRLDEFVRAEEIYFAHQRVKQGMEPMMFQELLRRSKSPESIAEMVFDELPVRFAARASHIQKFKAWEEIPELVEMVDMHRQSFRELRLVDDAEDREELSSVVRGVRDRHKKVVPLFAEAVKQMNQAGEDCFEDQPVTRGTSGGGSNLTLSEWSDRFLMSRISTEVLMAHYIASLEAGRDKVEKGGSSKIGIVDTQCDPYALCKEAAIRIQTQKYDCKIDVEEPICGSMRVCHTPRYLFYIVKELLGNAARATVERSVSRDMDSRPIKVTVCANDTQVVIRISDRAGGLPFESTQEMWTCLFDTHFQQNGPMNSLDTPDDVVQPWGVFKGSSPLTGRGIGLRLSRLYAIYLGGSLEVMNMPGMGVDTYLFLRRINP